MSVREYVITYIAKEYLQKNGWIIIAYNPPGSQGTFTITNPDKDAGYRGQTGSLSPDIVALKTTPHKNIFLIVESKPDFNKDDIEKMKSMFSNPQRLTLFFQIIKGHALANGIAYDESLEKVIYFAKAHGGELNGIEEISTILVEQKTPNWNIKNIDPKDDIYKHFSVDFKKLFSEN